MHIFCPFTSLFFLLPFFVFIFFSPQFLPPPPFPSLWLLCFFLPFPPPSFYFSPPFLVVWVTIPLQMRGQRRNSVNWERIEEIWKVHGKVGQEGMVNEGGDGERRRGQREEKKTSGYICQYQHLATFSVEAPLLLCKESTLGHSGLPLTVQFSLHTREPLANTAVGMHMIYMFIYA